VTQDGQLVFSERSRHGASVVTAYGIEHIDRGVVPRPVVRTSAFEPWRAPTGFLLPADGVLRETAKPVPIEARGMLAIVRPSDVIVPSWGGEILVRFDAIVPPEAHPEAAGSLRRPVRLVLVTDGAAAGSLPVAQAVLDSLGARDRIAVIDSERGPALPFVPGSHRSLLEGAVERMAVRRATGPRDLPRALARAGRMLAAGLPGEARHLIVVSDGAGVLADRKGVERAAERVTSRGARVTAIAASGGVDADLLEALGGEVIAGSDGSREELAGELLPPPGETVLSDVTLAVSSAPAPARLLEASAGEIAMSLEEDTLDLGDLYVGEARTEVLRVSVPAWTPGERWELRLRIAYRDGDGRRWQAERKIAMLYSDEIELLARRRHGDVIAYASALAMVRRLERAFLGEAVDRLGGMAAIVRWQAESMAVLARERRDRSLAQQAEVLGSLLAAIED
jgi:hypothetical protein